MSLNEKNIFLVDGIGALVSALMLGVVLPAFQTSIGMPTQILYVLAIVAAVFAVYSLSCFWFVKSDYPTWLRLIVMANSSYCLATLFVVFIFLPELKWLGIIYFLGEAALIFGLVLVERSIIRKAVEAEEQES